MFQPDSTIKFVPVTRDQVIAVVESINQSQVQLPGRTPEIVQAHLCGLRNPNGSFSIYLGIFLTKSRENVIYVHSQRQVTVENYPAVEVEGLQFLESMGFMVDNLNFRSLPPEQQDNVLRRVPMFNLPKPAPTASTPAAAEAPRDPASDELARFLASF